MKISAKTIQLNDESPCPIIGKYHNMPMGKVPAGYLDWFLGQKNLMEKYPAVLAYVEKNIKHIYYELEHPETSDE